MSEYQVEESTAREDLEELVDALVAEELIECRGPEEMGEAR